MDELMVGNFGFVLSTDQIIIESGHDVSSQVGSWLIWGWIGSTSSHQCTHKSNHLLINDRNKFELVYKIIVVFNSSLIMIQS